MLPYGICARAAAPIDSLREPSTTPTMNNVQFMEPAGKQVFQGQMYTCKEKAMKKVAAMKWGRSRALRN